MFFPLSHAKHEYAPLPLLFCFVARLAHRRDVDGATLSAGVKGRLRAQGDKLLKRVAAEGKAAAAAAAQSGVRRRFILLLCLSLFTPGEPLACATDLSDLHPEHDSTCILVVARVRCMHVYSVCT